MILLSIGYTQNGDYPFKVGTFMGSDDFGNRYYENRIDYPYGQHRWIEPRDINNYDSSQIPPEWHGWMCHVSDQTPSLEDEYVASKPQIKGEISHAPFANNLGHQEPVFNFHGMHNQSQIRSRGYGIGNPVVGLPPGAPDAYYTQPGSPYNPASRQLAPMVGALDANGGRAYKSDLWKKRLMTAAETKVETDAEKEMIASHLSAAGTPKLSPREQAILARGGTVAK
jgi:NADH:ubiquinone oxidoreductase subunit